MILASRGIFLAFVSEQDNAIVERRGLDEMLEDLVVDVREEWPAVSDDYRAKLRLTLPDRATLLLNADGALTGSTGCRT